MELCDCNGLYILFSAIQDVAYLNQRIVDAYENLKIVGPPSEGPRVEIDYAR